MTHLLITLKKVLQMLEVEILRGASKRALTEQSGRSVEQCGISVFGRPLYPVSTRRVHNKLFIFYYYGIICTEYLREQNFL